MGDKDAYLGDNLKSSSQPLLFRQILLGPFFQYLGGRRRPSPLASPVENDPRSGNLLV